MDQESVSANSSRSLRALVFCPPTAESFVVGSLEMTERWQLGLSRWGAAPEKWSTTAELLRRLDTSHPTLIAWGNWAADPLATEEMISQASDSCAPDEIISFIVPGMPLAPLLCVGHEAARLFQAIPAVEMGDGSDTLLAQIKQQYPDAAIQIRQIVLKAGHWSLVQSHRDAKRATWKMLWQLQWRPGGIVAKYLNRPLSIPLSYLLMNTPVTPNMTTFFAFIVGAAGIVALFLGGYWNVVIAGVLLQANSIIDGIDGELARIRLKTSEFGAYFDSVCDEILNALLFIGIGYDLTRVTGAPVYLWVGVFSGIMAFLYSLTHWHCKWKHGLGLYWWFEAYRPRKQVQQSTSFFSYFKKLFWKESYLFIFMVTAFFSFHQLLLWIALPAASAVFVLLFIHVFIKRARW